MGVRNQVKVTNRCEKVKVSSSFPFYHRDAALTHTGCLNENSFFQQLQFSVISSQHSGFCCKCQDQMTFTCTRYLKVCKHVISCRCCFILLNWKPSSGFYWEACKRNLMQLTARFFTHCCVGAFFFLNDQWQSFLAICVISNDLLRASCLMMMSCRWQALLYHNTSTTTFTMLCTRAAQYKKQLNNCDIFSPIIAMNILRWHAVRYSCTDTVNQNYYHFGYLKPNVEWPRAETTVVEVCFLEEDKLG